MPFVTLDAGAPAAALRRIARQQSVVPFAPAAAD